MSDYEYLAMDEVRVFIATIVFCISLYLGYDLFANGFSWFVLIACLGGFVLVHYIRPRNSSADSNWYDIFEIIIDLPYQAMAVALRAITRSSRGSSGDVGIDP